MRPNMPFRVIPQLLCDRPRNANGKMSSLIRKHPGGDMNDVADWLTAERWAEAKDHGPPCIVTQTYRVTAMLIGCGATPTLTSAIPSLSAEWAEIEGGDRFRVS